VHLDHIFFGDILSIDDRDLLVITASAIVIIGCIACKRRDLLLCAFDKVQALAVGLPVKFLHYELLLLLALSAVISLRVVGCVLAIAVLIIPGATACLLFRSFDAMLLASICVALFSSLGGVWFSFYLDTALGPTVVLCMTCIFILAFVIRWLVRLNFVK